MRGLRAKFELTVLLITHDLGVVAENADRVGVMYAGRVVEEAPVKGLFHEPGHPYTRGLLRAMPGADPSRRGDRRLPTLPGGVPDPADPPPGCRFHPRCPERFEPCDHLEPRETAVTPGRRVACHLYLPAGATTEQDRVR